MSNRLTKIYTRTGDDGSTDLADGSRTSKNSPCISTMGAVDELNSHIGLLRAQLADGDNAKINPANNTNLDNTCLDAELSIIQHVLFNLGGQLAMPKYQLIQAAHSSQLESWLDAHNANLPPLKDFILPAGSLATAQAHVCRSVCRRAERDLVTLHEAQGVASELLTYINRLSDYLFVIARVVARQHMGQEVFWDKHVTDDNKP